MQTSQSVTTYVPEYYMISKLELSFNKVLNDFKQSFNNYSRNIVNSRTNKMRIS